MRDQTRSARLYDLLKADPMTSSEAAARLGVSRAAVNAMLRRMPSSFEKVGRLWCTTEVQPKPQRVLAARALRQEVLAFLATPARTRDVVFHFGLTRSRAESALRQLQHDGLIKVAGGRHHGGFLYVAADVDVDDYVDPRFQRTEGYGSGGETLLGQLWR